MANTLLATIADAIPEPVLVVSATGRLEALNAAGADLCGLDSAAVGEVTLAELVADRAAARALIAAGLEGEWRGEQDAAQTLRFYGPSCRSVTLHARPWRIAAVEPAVVGLRLHETAAGRHRRALAGIAEGIAKARKLSAAERQSAGLAAAVSGICTVTGWAYAEAWIPDEREDERWLPHPFWYGSRDRYQTFRDLSLKAAAAAPLPLVSRVAREQSSSWYSDVSVVPLAVYRRARAAREAGLRATFAQPVVEAGRTLAVLVFMMAEARARDDALAELMAAVARQLVPLFRAPAAMPAPCTTAPLGRPRAGQESGETPTEVSLLYQLLGSLDKAAMIVNDATRSIAWANASACRIFGHGLERLVGLPVARLQADARPPAEAAVPAGETGKAVRRCTRLRREDGAGFVCEILVIPLGGPAGRRLSVWLVTDLGEPARYTFGIRLDQLSSRELEVFQLTIAGASVTEIAEVLALSVRTVEVHRSHLLHKLGCASTTKLLAALLADSVGQRARL
jgi:DNA-binding CsgD family transcriptional regulator